jgi:hypothetical protein
MAALITSGSFYQLENTGPRGLMGHRSGSQDNVMIIDYVTRQDIRKSGGPRCVAAPAAGQAGVTNAIFWRADVMRVHGA